MATKKDGGKNRKFGRHARNPSSVNQARRTERNKDRRIAANPQGRCREGKSPTPSPKYNNPRLSASGKHLWAYVEFRGVRELVYCL